MACATVLPGGVSIYRWKGEVEQQDEAVVMLKTTAARWRALATALAELHPYEVPELIAVPACAGLPAYLQWVSDETAVVGTRKE